MDKRKSGDKRTSKDISGNDAMLTKDEKLLKLLGGKKAKNAGAANEWIKKTSDKEKVQKISSDLERQFNDSMQNKLSGNTRMHTGIGFSEAPKPAPNSHITFSDSDTEETKLTSSENNPQKKSTGSTENTTDEKPHKIQNKKDFYAQFAKSSSSNDTSSNEKKDDNSTTKKQIKTKKDFYSQFAKASS